MKKIILTISISIFIPVITYADTIKSISGKVANFFGKTMMVLLFSAALAMFLWGIVDFIKNSDNPEAREKGKKRMLWGIVALFAMVAYLGLTGVFTNTFFGGDPILPQLYESK